MIENTQGTLSIESNNIFTILKKWLYTEPDIVFRELISNATDAVEKRNLILQENARLPVKGHIQVTLDKENRLLTISDNGIGMDYDEVHKYINKIAFSGAEDFIRANNESGRNSIIGHFGVGFYSAFMLTDHVAIETKSYKEDAPAVRWDCTSDMNYDMKQCEKEQPGTDIILYLGEDNPFLKKPELAYDSIRKYFVFSRYDIFFAADGAESAVPVNNTDAIWRKAKDDIQKDQMNEFYKDYFNETTDPLFWIQFSSIDIGVRGILFFRNTRNGTEELDGQIHVFNRGIYVGKNIPELIPKFVNLQSGIIECDNLPLVVSRSAIQNDDTDHLLKLVYECLSQEVTIALYEIFQNERNLYETHWPEINAFVKYGILQDKTFSSVMMKRVVFDDVYGKYQTIDEYLNEDPENPKKTIYYSSDRLDQAHYISIFKKCGVNALLFDHVIDQALLYKYETVYPKCKFIRIDSNIEEIYGGLLEDGDEEKTAALTETITATLGDRLGTITLCFTRLENESISALIVNDEATRRMADMMEIYGYMNRADTQVAHQTEKSLLFNLNNPMVKNLSESKDDVKSQMVIQQLFDLALLSQQALLPEDMEAFINRSEVLLQYCQ
ncbi:MAG: molecular chaperone HtpG [Lachnospiraceae bacterium]